MLNPQQETFCQAYTTKGDTFSNAYKAYSYAYNIDIPLTEDNKIDYKSSAYNVCHSSGSRLLLNENIKERIQAILYERFQNNIIADVRIQSIIEGGKDTDAIQAVKVFNDLKQRITKKIDITTAGRPLAGLSDEELEEML